MRRRPSVAVLVGLGVLLLRGEPDAQGSDLDREFGFLEAEEIEKIPLEVASRGPAIPAGQAPAVVDVITSEEIRASGARTLAELLAQRVGIDVSLDAVVPRGLNTAPSTALVPLQNNRSLLLIDGRPSNGFVFDQFLAGRELPLEHIARIEIIRGPGSALYGTNAMAGVINVVTKDAADLPRLGALVEGGSFSTRRSDVFGGVGGPRRNGSFFFRYYGDAGTNQIQPNDDRDQFFGFARSTLGPLTLYAEALSFREETPGEIGAETPEDRINHDRYSIGASLVKRLGERFRFGGRSYVNLYQTRFLVVQGEPRDRTAYDDDRYGQELYLTYEPSEWLAVTLGAEGRLEEGSASICHVGDGSSTEACDFDRNAFALFLEDQLRLPGNTTLTAGFRYDDISSFGNRFSPRVNLLWRPGGSTSFKIGYGEAFRAPSFFELRAFQAFGSGLVGDPNQFVFGSRDLDAEVVRTVDGEVAHRFARALNVRLAAFFTRGEDLIAQAEEETIFGLGLCPPLCVPIVSPPAETRFLFTNSDRVTVAGMEVAAGGIVSAGLPGDLSWGVNYTFQDAETRFRNPDTGDLGEIETPLAPDHKVNVLLDYRPVEVVSLFWHSRWIDERPTGVEDPPTLAGLFDHNVNLVYRFSREIELALGVYNLFDGDRVFTPRVPRESRAFLASVSYRIPSSPALPSLPRPEQEPAELAEARAAVERARSAGAADLGLTSWKEAAAHLMIAEELQRKGELRERVVAAAERARTAAEVARDLARSETMPSATATPPMPAPTPTPSAVSPRRATPHATRTAAPSLPAVTPTPTPSPRPTATPTAVPTPTPDLTDRAVLLLQSDGQVTIYRSAAAALMEALPARIRFEDVRGDPERGREVLSERAAEADLVVAVGSLAASLARETPGARALLYCAVLNPERYAGPRNVAGVSFEVSPEAQLRGLRQALPGRGRVGVIYDPARSGATVEAAEQVAGELGMRIVKQEATRPEDVDFLFRSLRGDIDVLWLLPDSTVVTRESFELLALQAAEAGIPMVAFAEAFARQGALLAFYPDPAAVGRQCGNLAAAILRGDISPAEIGPRFPDRFACAVNRRIGGQLGVEVPAGMCSEVGG